VGKEEAGGQKTAHVKLLVRRRDKDLRSTYGMNDLCSYQIWSCVWMNRLVQVNLS